MAIKGVGPFRSLVTGDNYRFNDFVRSEDPRSSHTTVTSPVSSSEEVSSSTDKRSIDTPVDSYVTAEIDKFLSLFRKG